MIATYLLTIYVMYRHVVGNVTRRLAIFKQRILEFLVTEN